MHPSDKYRVRPVDTPVFATGSNTEPTPAQRALLPAILHAERLATIGRDEGLQEELFGRLEVVLLDAENRIYALDSAFENVRVFSINGEYLGAVGRQGQGPGEFIRPTAMAISPDQYLHVSDSTRRVQVFRLSQAPNESATPATYERTYHLKSAVYAMCFLDAQLVTHGAQFVTPEALSGARALDTNLILVHSSDAVESIGFGNVYDAPDPMVRFQHSRGKLTCASQSRRVYLTPEVNLGETHVYTATGVPVWILLYSGFRPLEVTEPEPGRVRQIISEEGLDVVTSTIAIASQVLVQIEHKVPEVGTGDLEVVDLRSYLVDQESGTAYLIPTELPEIVAANRDYMVSVRHLPNPVLDVLNRNASS